MLRLHVAPLNRVCLLTLCWAVAGKVGDVQRPHGRQLREASSHVLAPLLLQRGSTDTINPFKSMFGGKASEDPKKKQRVMSAINAFRAATCARMHEENGNDFSSYEACLAFMEKVCHPGKDMKMDGDKREHTSGKGYCTEFFPEAQAKAEAQIAEEDRKAEEEAKKKKEAESVFPDAEAIAKQAAEALGGAEEEKKKEAVPAPAAPPPPPRDLPVVASPAAAPSPARGPASAPAVAGAAAGAPAAAAASGKTGGSPAGAPGGAPGSAPGGDEAWYYKDGGKHMKSRIGNMDGSRGLPTQGFRGKLVGHEDMETSISDWQREHGGGSYADQWKAICAAHPDSAWCEASAPKRSRHFWESGSARTHLAGLLLVLGMAMVDLV